MREPGSLPLIKDMETQCERGVFMGRLENKTAIITGANSGVGRAAAIRFAAEGAKVVLCARREENLRTVAEEVHKQGGEAVCVPGDVALPETAKHVVAACMEQYGSVDVLINCAGMISKMLSSVEKCTDDEEFDRIMAVNAKGAFYMMRAVIPHMLAVKGGSIVNVASVAGSHGLGDARYVASKGAVIALTKHTAIMHSAHNINCNAICPETIITPLISANMRGEGMDSETMEAMNRHSAEGLPVNLPETIASTLLFLASDEGKNITGQIIDCDYGYSL